MDFCGFVRFLHKDLCRISSSIMAFVFLNFRILRISRVGVWDFCLVIDASKVVMALIK